MPPVPDLLPAFVLLAVLARAAWTDLREHRISNRLVVGTLLSAAALQVATASWAGLFDAAGGAAVGLVAFLPFYLFKGMGAADVKWMAAVGAFLDPAVAALAVCLTLIAGSVLALGLIRVERIWGLNLLTLSGSYGTATASARRRFPYAPAIAAGTLTTLFVTSG